eukprot:5212742-Prymnesium_polylepis.1
MSGSRCPEASGSFPPASSLVQSRAHNTHAVTVNSQSPFSLSHFNSQSPTHNPDSTLAKVLL